MPPVSDDDLQAQRKEIENLRDEEVKADAQYAESVAERSREIEKQRLDREQARVKRRLEGKRQRANSSTGTSAPATPPPPPGGGGERTGAQRSTPPTNQE